MITYSMRGQKIDMALLMASNSHKVALGNGHMNARGDRIGSNGSVLATREEMMQEYNVNNPKAVKHVGLNDLRHEVLHPEPVESAVKPAPDKAVKRKIADTE